MKTTIVISDIHGCYDTLIELLNLCPKGDIIFAGDLVDRGPDSRKVIDYAIKHNIQCVLGNHDDMMIDWVKGKGIYKDGIWLMNGGITTLNNYSKRGVITDTMRKHADWLDTLPLTITVGDYLISHTGHVSGDRFQDLWYRGEPSYNSKYIIFGHTPHEKPNVQKKWACIDTGCAYKNKGHLTAMILPSMETITIANKNIFNES